ncbi:hypothetical protein [Mycobacterium deserti]|uniref:Uncharacterized protein n=1 Tax=Mycobacterium deserti TaxID=2978347 RepID=A0ABT2MHY4_9MYCO|nr:hypothetical protein [Mycobacterium deserti]MCT7661895.1 hypothetical protein [Mycobacterium deserti]
MTHPEGLAVEGAEADVVEQLTPVEDRDDDDTWRDADRVTAAKDWHANEADLIEQAIDVPEDEADFDR